uniref:wu:fb59e12 isoform 2 precursor n=1 Tax=Danio rerio TaxID=7955 RepID=UPI00403CE3FC
MMAHFQLSQFHLLYFLMAALLEHKVAMRRPCEKLHELNISCVQHNNMSISCLTTTYPLESLMVKLRKNNPVKDILIYPDISPASEHQRWSVRKHAGNVTLGLKDVRLSDEGLYECQVYKDQDCLDATRFILTVKECKTLDPVSATSGSAVLLPCSEHPQQNTADQVTWKVIEGHRLTDITQYRFSFKTSNSTEQHKLLKPLFERARRLENGSLLIRDSVKADEQWYQCTVNDTTCYEVKLLIKVVSDHSTPATSTIGQTQSYVHTNADMKTDPTAVLMATITSLFVLILLIICVSLYFKKRRRKINNQTFDDPVYSVVNKRTNNDHIWCEQAAVYSCIPDHVYASPVL